MNLDAGADVPTSADSSKGRPVDPFNGDCSSARWANVSDDCWSCFCRTCQPTLDQCADDCVKGFYCGTENHVLVGVAADLACEGRAFAAVCDADPAIKAAETPITAFDICLIGAHDPVTDHLRACESECGITYTDDVCQRFPAPASTDAGP